MPEDPSAARARTDGDAVTRTGDASPGAPEGGDRVADLAGIDRLLDGLVPTLMAKVATLGVGELEVRQGDWRIRLRRPIGGPSQFGRRATDRPGQRIHPGHEGLGAPATPRPAPQGGSALGGGPATNGSGGPALAAVGPGHRADTAGQGDEPAELPSAHGPVATSPAVGVFQPGAKAVGGTRVQAGDRLGVVDMLGVPQDVLAPADGIVIGVIVEAGTAVEYGQDLVHIEASGAVGAR